jgi:hypothetical protein
LPLRENKQQDLAALDRRGRVEELGGRSVDDFENDLIGR